MFQLLRSYIKKHFPGDTEHVYNRSQGQNGLLPTIWKNECNTYPQISPPYYTMNMSQVMFACWFLFCMVPDFVIKRVSYIYIHVIDFYSNNKQNIICEKWIAVILITFALNSCWQVQCLLLIFSPNQKLSKQLLWWPF